MPFMRSARFPQKRYSVPFSVALSPYGYLMITKRLSGQNRFQWPRNEEDMKNITMEQYRNLMEGFTIEGSIREL